MQINYISQWLEHEHSSFCLPYWMTNPLHIIETEDKVLVIHTAESLPKNIEAAVINEIAVFARLKTMLYSFTNSSVTVIKTLIEQLEDVEDLLKTNIRYSKDCHRLTDAVKAIEKAPLYINDRQMNVVEFINDIKNNIAETEKKRNRYRIIIIDDILSLTDFFVHKNENPMEGQSIIERLNRLAQDLNISIIVMCKHPITELFPDQRIQKAYITIDGEEYTIDTILTD